MPPKSKTKPQDAPEAATDIPKEQREFTTREKGGHVVYLQRLVPGIPNGPRASAPLKRAITVRLQRGIKFDPFVECGTEGKNRLFRDITPEAAFEALKEKAEERESPVCYWDDRPMTEQESQHSKEIKTANKRADEQAEANAKLLALLEEKGIKVPEEM